MLLCRIIRSLILQRSESNYCCCCFRSNPFVFENFNLKVRGITSQRWRSTILSIDECRLFSVNLVQCIIILEPHLPTAYSWRFLLPSYPVGNVRSYNDAWLSRREKSEIRLGFGLVWFDAKHPGKQFFNHVWTEPSLPVYNQYFFQNMSCSRTQHGDSSGVRTPDFWIQSPRC